MPAFLVDITDPEAAQELCEFEVYCSCGAPICNNCDTRHTGRMGRGNVLTVEPCEKCLERRAEKAYEEGQNSMEGTIADLKSEVKQLAKELDEVENRLDSDGKF